MTRALFMQPPESVTPSEAPVQLRLQSEAQHVCVARAAAEMAASRWGLDPRSCGQIGLAVNEALVNIIRHGYRGECGRPIWVSLAPVCRAGRCGVMIVIEDETRGVNLAGIKSRPLNEIRPGGLGVHIIRQTMDEVQYRQRPNGGVELRMLKFATPPARERGA